MDNMPDSMEVSAEAFATCLAMISGDCDDLGKAIERLGVQDPAAVAQQYAGASESLLGSLDAQSLAACNLLGAKKLVCSL